MYINARRNNKTECIDVVERIDGERVYKSYPIDYSFYVSDPRGEHTSIYRTPLRKITPKTSQELYKEIAINKNRTLWESDVNYVFRCLEQQYRRKPSPKLQVSFYDIEVDFDPLRGYAPVDDPFNEITSITIYHQWLDMMITLAVRPKRYTESEANDIANKFDNTVVFETEEEMLEKFLDMIEDSDVLCGWNSLLYDLPYIIGRIRQVLTNTELRKLSLWNELPTPKTIVRYGKENNTYDLVGRVHCDYMDLYKKYTQGERHSYALNAISEYELKDSKTPYTGTLDQLYNYDFEKFIEYNRKDVFLIHLLDMKLKFISLIMDIAHDTCTLVATCMGTVASTDQAIMNYAHEMGMIVPNKKRDTPKKEEDDEIPVVEGEEEIQGIAGAHVAHPKVGLCDYLGIIDINSLYPSTIRALNMGLETIVGQLRPTYTKEFIKEKFKTKNMTYAKAWEGQFGSLEYQYVMERRPDCEMIIDWEADGSSDTASADEVYRMVFESGKKWMLSGNGTIFTYEYDSIIPTLLTTWYAERKKLQAEKADYEDLLAGIELGEDMVGAIING